MEDTTPHTLYRLSDDTTCYIGCTRKPPRARLYEHLRDALIKTHAGEQSMSKHMRWLSTRLQEDEAWMPMLEELEVVNGMHPARARERELIREHVDAGYELSNVTTKRTYKLTPEDRQRRRERAKRLIAEGTLGASGGHAKARNSA